MVSKTAEYHKKFADDIIAMLEKGTAPWQKPWEGIPSVPINGKTGRRYRGINFISLYIATNEKEYTDPRWMTFKQIQEVGGKVKRGEHGEIVEYWMFEDKLRDQDNKPILDDEGKYVMVKLDHPRIIRSTVFNVDQTEGVPPLKKPNHQWTPDERAEAIIKANGVPIYHDQADNNYYSPVRDEIHLTPRESFPAADAYYGTALHEVGHSTGHESRLNRDMKNTFGSPDYAKEELRAEIASFMLCTEIGINHNPTADEQHAAYVGSWIQALKNDPNEIYRAAADAEKICDYLYEREKEYIKLQDVNSDLKAQSEVNGRKEDIMTKSNFIPATEAQKAYMMNIGIKFNDAEISKEDARVLIKERVAKIEARNEKLNAPISPEQKAVLEKNNVEIKENMTNGEAMKIISNLPATQEQKKYMDRLKISYDKDIKFSAAMQSIEKKLRELEERDNLPMTDKQKEMLSSHGIEVKEEMTLGEARRAIYSLPATEKQVAYLDSHKVEYDKEKLNHGIADRLIKAEMERIEAIRKEPATKEQLERMEKNKIAYQEGITKGEASDKIHAHKMEALKITDKQMEMIKKYDLELPDGADRKMAAQMINVAMRNAAIESFAAPVGRKFTLTEGYLALAQKQMRAGKNIDDKAIAAELLKEGHSMDNVKKVIFKNSPANSYAHAMEKVQEAAKMPSVAQKIKEAGRNM